MAEPIRLAKRVAAMVPCSRREAEEYIEGGWVRVDGLVVHEPQHRVADEQRVELDTGAATANLEPVTLLLHKPVGANDQQALALLSPATHASDDDSGVRSVKRHFVRLVPLLPLPSQASGLAVFSQDGRIIRKLTEDALSIEQELIAQVTGTIMDNGLARLAHGLVYEGRPLPPIKVSWQNETRLRFALKGIPPWLVEWMCAQVGLRLTALKRIRIGRVPMAALPEGQWRYLRAGERF
ncbi:rRNA pseudouridine synthase [Ramlibacter sp. WS9]|uniref:rRNA pseudouridine synthase n=1 Tax=Ramlibacter sp. WS9 TaxID=1882741 RepID=UPI00114366D8|nr:rRNA pseudouridine synthase [Ramlibacter sp. WS9]ROZ63917.1 RNA-binding protein [Ramlibacter sp. WS9]